MHAPMVYMGIDLLYSSGIEGIGYNETEPAFAYELACGLFSGLLENKGRVIRPGNCETDFLDIS